MYSIPTGQRLETLLFYQADYYQENVLFPAADRQQEGHLRGLQLHVHRHSLEGEAAFTHARELPASFVT